MYGTILKKKGVNLKSDLKKIKHVLLALLKHFRENFHA